MENNLKNKILLIGAGLPNNILLTAATLKKKLDAADIVIINADEPEKLKQYMKENKMDISPSRLPAPPVLQCAEPAKYFGESKNFINGKKVPRSKNRNGKKR